MTLLRSLLYTLYRAIPLRGEIVARSAAGHRYVTPKHDDIGRAIFKRGVHEPAISAWVQAHVAPAPGELVLDVGANFGYYAVLFAGLGSGAHTVLAFEPEPYNYGLLARNLALNGARNVRPFRLALGERSEQRDLTLYKASNRGRHSLLDLHDGSKMSVEVRSLDDLLDEQGLANAPIALMKLDVEGFEFLVLKGAERAARRTRHVVLEYSPQYFGRSGLGAGFFEAFLQRHAFRCRVFTEAGATDLAIEEILRSPAQRNLLLSRASAGE